MRAPCGPALLCVALLCSTPQCWGTRSDELLPSEPLDAAGGATSGVVHRGPPVLQYAQPPIHPHCLIDGAAAPAHPRPRGDWGEEWLVLPYGGDVAASDGHRRAEGPGAEGHARLAGEEMALRLAKQAAAQAQRAVQEDQAHRASVSVELDEEIEELSMDESIEQPSPAPKEGAVPALSARDGQGDDDDDSDASWASQDLSSPTAAGSAARASS